jgi:hypothetical protein
MMTPQAPEGDIAQARLGVALAVKVLQRVAMQVNNPQVKSPLVGVIAQLTKTFGPFDPRMSDSMVTGLMARAKGPGSPGNTPQPPPQAGGGGPPGGGAPPPGAHPKTAAPPGAAG